MPCFLHRTPFPLANKQDGGISNYCNFARDPNDKTPIRTSLLYYSRNFPKKTNSMAPKFSGCHHWGPYKYLKIPQTKPPTNATQRPRLHAKRFQRNAAFAAASRQLLGAQQRPLRKAKLEAAILKASIEPGGEPWGAWKKAGFP